MAMRDFSTAESDAAALRRRRFAPYVYAAVAAGAMLATLPGRTHGLGLVTVPLLADFQMEAVPYSMLNLWATLLGAMFCLPCGWLLDRLGVRVVLTGNLAALGSVVIVMAQLGRDGAELPLPSFDVGSFAFGTVRVPAMLFVLVLLTRGFGQSALSVVSLALMGKAAGRSPGPIVGVYSFLVSIFFMAAFKGVQVAFEELHADWRSVWGGIGWAIVGSTVLVALFVRDPAPAVESRSVATDGATLFRALGTPAFWLFGLATSLYGLVGAGVSLFNQSILAERGFDRSVFLDVTILAPMVGLAANLATGVFARRFGLGKLMAIAMVVLASALLAFPYVTRLAEVYAYAVAMGIAGGMVTVLFFAVWGQAFGPRHLGTIQGAAQLLTVLSSALGPVVLAVSHRAYGSYVPIFQQLAGVALLFAVAGWFVPVSKFAPPLEVVDDGDDR